MPFSILLPKYVDSYHEMASLNRFSKYFTNPRSNKIKIKNSNTYPPQRDNEYLKENQPDEVKFW